MLVPQRSAAGSGRHAVPSSIAPASASCIGTPGTDQRRLAVCAHRCTLAPCHRISLRPAPHPYHRDPCRIAGRLPTSSQPFRCSRFHQRLSVATAAAAGTAGMPSSSGNGRDARADNGGSAAAESSSAEQTRRAAGSGASTSAVGGGKGMKPARPGDDFVRCRQPAQMMPGSYDISRAGNRTWAE